MLLLAQLAFASLEGRRRVFHNLLDIYRETIDEFNQLPLERRIQNNGAVLIEFEKKIAKLKVSDSDIAFFWVLCPIFEKFLNEYKIYQTLYHTHQFIQKPAYIKRRRPPGKPKLWMDNQEAVLHEIQELSTFYNSLKKSYGLRFENFLEPGYWIGIQVALSPGDEIATHFAEAMTLNIRLFLTLENFLMKKDIVYRLMEHLRNSQLLPRDLINDIFELGESKDKKNARYFASDL